MCNSYARACAARFINKQCLVTVDHLLQEQREVILMSLQRLHKYDAISKHCIIRCRLAAEILCNIYLFRNVKSTSPLTASAIYRIAHFVSLYEVIPVELKHPHRFHMNTTIMYKY